MLTEMLKSGKNMKQRIRRRNWRNQMLKKEEKILKQSEINKMERDVMKFSEILYCSICLDSNRQFFKTTWAAQASCHTMRRENMTTPPALGIFFPMMYFYTHYKDLRDSRSVSVIHVTTVSIFKGRHLFS